MKKGRLALLVAVALALGAGLVLPCGSPASGPATPRLGQRAPPARAAAGEISDGVRPRSAADIRPEWTPSLSTRVLAEGADGRTGALRGRVVDLSGAAVEGAWVVLEGSGASAEVLSGAAGRFAFERLAPGDYALAASHQGRAAQPVDGIPLGAGEVLEGLVLVLEPGAAVAGRVCDAAGGAAPDAAAVRIACGPARASVRADRSGRFAVRGLPGGPCSLTVAAPDFAVREETFHLPAGRMVKDLRVCLERAGTLVGRVTAGGTPVAGAFVTAWIYRQGRLERTHAPPARTASDGAFSVVEVPPGRVVAIASAEGWAPGRSEEVDLAPGETRRGLDIELSPGGAIGGVVRDPRGALVLAAIEVVELESGRPAGAATQAPDGSFRVDGLSPGRYAVAASAGEARALATGVEVQDREETRVDLVLGGRTLHGRVADEHYRPIAGATVRASPEGTVGVGARLVVADTQGAFSIGGLPEGTWTLWAEAPGHAAEERRGIKPGGAPVVFLLQEGGTLEGVVTDPFGAPVGDFFVTVTPEPAPTGPLGARYRAARLLAPDGTFLFFDLPAGRYQVRAQSAGLVADEEAVDLPRGGWGRAQLTLSRGAAVEGRVVRMRPGPQGEAREEPVPGAVVASNWDKIFAFGRVDEVPGRVAYAGADGRFVLDGLSSGESTIVATAPGFGRTAVQVVLQPGERKRISITLRDAPENENREFGGIGCSVRVEKNGDAFITSVIEGGPAFRAGARAGDRIVGIDGQPAPRAIEPLMQRLRGPVGSRLVLDLARGSTQFTTVVERVRIVL